MTRLRYLMTEGVELCCTVADPAAYLNALCRAGIPFTDVSLEADGCHLLVPPRCRGACVAQAQALKLPCSQVRRHGIRHFFRRFRRRAYLWLLPLLLFVITGVFSTFLWEIRVSGAETISNARILQALEESGVYPGVNGLALRNLEIRGRMQLALPELIWCTVQVHGSRAEVKVRERTQPPKMVEEGVPCDLMARKTGLITFLSVLNGDALVKKGQMVLQGETLVTGTLSDRWDQTRTVHAMGEVWARTWYEKSMSMPLVQTEKYYTGQETTRRALKICDLRLNIYGNSGNPYPDCDKIEQETRLCVFGLALPVSVVKTAYRAYSPVEEIPSPEYPEVLLQERLANWLREQNGGAEVTMLRFTARAEAGLLTVTLEAECLEQIAMEAPPAPLIPHKRE